MKIGDIKIFKDASATPESKRPLFKIKVDLEGQAYEIPLWKRSTRQGETYYGGEIKRETQERAAPPAQQGEASFDEIPF